VCWLGVFVFANNLPSCLFAVCIVVILVGFCFIFTLLLAAVEEETSTTAATTCICCHIRTRARRSSRRAQFLFDMNIMMRESLKSEMHDGDDALFLLLLHNSFPDTILHKFEAWFVEVVTSLYKL